MASLSDILNTQASLAAATPAQRADVLDKVYGVLKQKGVLNSEKLRAFRGDQMDTFIEDDAKNAPPIDAATAASYGMVGQLPERDTIVDRDTYDRLRKRNALADLQDVGRIASQPEQYGAAVAKLWSDLSGLGFGLYGMLDPAGLGRYKLTGEPVFGNMSFSEGLSKFNELDRTKELNAWYKEVIKDDPDLAKRFHTAVTDGVMGSMFGAARVARAASTVGESAAAATKRGLSKLREFFAPVAATTTGGQLVYSGVEGLGEALNNTELSDEVKAGLTLAGALALGVASGMGPERVIEGVVSGEAATVKAVQNLGKVVKQAEDSGVDFKTALAQNPDLSEEARQLLGLTDEVDPTTGQILEGSGVGAKLDEITEAVAKADMGEELSIEEANIVKELTAEPPTAPIHPDDAAEQLGELSSQAQIQARTALEERLNFLDDDELARIDAEAEAAKEPEFIERLRDRRQPLEKPKETEASTEQPTSPSELADTDTASTASTPPTNEAAQNAPKYQRGKYNPSIREEAPTKAERAKRPEPTWDSITLSRSALESLDILTSTGRATQAALKAATTAGDAAEVTRLSEQLSNVKAQVSDMQKLITLEMGGSRDLQNLVDKELKGIEQELTDLRDEWRRADLEARKVEIEKKAIALKEAQQRMQDRKTVFQRIPKRAGKKLLQRLRDERASRATNREAEPSAPFQEKISRKDAETRLGTLSGTERVRAMKVASAAQSGMEDILGRALSEEERLDVLASVLNDKQTWADNPFTPTDVSVFQASTGESLVAAGYVGEKYPLASNVLRVLNPEAAKTGVYTPDQVLQLAQSLTNRAGFGMDAQGWLLQHDVMKQVYGLWDDVRTNLPKAKGSNLHDFLKTAMPGTTSRVIDRIASTINRAFPALDISFSMDALPKGAAATTDSLTKLITVGLDKIGLKELCHEIGHLNFWHGMDADSRLAWMDGMRGRATNEVSWANAFPEYAERQLALGELDDAGRAAAEFWMHSPSEMYAQQFSAYMINSVLPDAETLSTFQEAWRGLKRTMGMATDSWETLPADSRELIVKTLASPDPTEARPIPSAEIEEGLKNNWLYSDKEGAEERVLEMRQMFEATYGQRMEAIPTSETLISDVSQDVPMASFFDLPVEQRVAAYSLNDLPQVAEMHALSLLHDLPGGDYQELQLALKRLHNDLSGERRADLLDALVTQMQPVRSKYGNGFDPRTKEQLDALTGKSMSKAEIFDIATTSAYNEYNRLSSASKNAIASDNARKAKREWVRRQEAAAKTLEDEKASGRIASYSKQDIDALAERIWDIPTNAIEGRAAATYKELTETATTTEQLYTMAEKQLAALDAQLDNVADFSRYVLASRGLVQALDPSFTQRLSKAEMYARIASGNAKWDWDRLMWKTGLQTAFATLTGLESDPNGTYIPFLGTVSWSPETFYETAPLGIFLLPGMGRASKWAAKSVIKNTKPHVSSALQKLPPNIRLRGEQLAKTVRNGFLTVASLPTDLQQIVQGAKVYGLSKKQDFYVFAETMARHFSPEDRAAIAKIYGQEAGYYELVSQIGDTRPDIMAAVDMTRKLYTSISKMFEDVGLSSKSFQDLGDHYINRLYDGIGKKPTAAIFLDYDISPIRAGFLKSRGVSATIKNRGKVVSGESSMTALTQLRQDASAAGLEIREGLKVNAWEMSDGTVMYSIPGTAYDQTLRNQGIPSLHQWRTGETGYVVTSVGPNSVKVRRDFTGAERKGLNEVVDVAVRGAAMGEQLEKDLRQGMAFFGIANSKYAKRAEDASEARELINQGWSKVPYALDNKTGLEKFGALAGMYIHPDAKIALKTLESSAFSKLLRAQGERYPAIEALMGAHRKLLNAWKISKTVLSPVAHANNFVSNLAMGYLMGHNSVADLLTGLKLSEIRNLDIRYKKLIKNGDAQGAMETLQHIKSHEYFDYFKEMRDARMSDSSLWATELDSHSLLEELKQANIQPGDSVGTLQQTLAKGYGTIKGGVGSAVKTAGHWYEKGDLLFKMGAFVNARKAGKSADEAVKYAYEAYFDYGNLSPIAKTLRDSGVVPFVSYIYNAVPALIKGIRQNPERFAAMALMLEGLHLASVGAVYGPEEVISKKEALDLAMPEYMQKRSLGGLFRARILNPLGSDANLQTPQGDVAKNQYLDIARMIPGGDLWETNTGISNVDFSLNTPGELLFSFINQGPLMAMMTTMATGKNPQLDIPLTDGGAIDTAATTERRNMATAKMVYNTLVPNLPFIPGTPTNQAIGEALAGTGLLESFGDSSGLDSMGMPKSLGTAVAGVFGAKLRDIYPEVSLEGQMRHLDFQMIKEAGRLNKVLRSPKYSEAYKDSEIEKLEQSAAQVEERQQRRQQMLDRINEARQKAQGGQALLR